ncbi:hypothetical protein ACB092_09G034400 [Castanea dentata]
MKDDNCIRKENLQEKLIVDKRLSTLKRFCQLLILINYSSSRKQ